MGRHCALPEHPRRHIALLEEVNEAFVAKRAAALRAYVEQLFALAPVVSSVALHEFLEVSPFTFERPFVGVKCKEGYLVRQPGTGACAPAAARACRRAAHGSVHVFVCSCVRPQTWRRTRRARAREARALCSRRTARATT